MYAFQLTVTVTWLVWNGCNAEELSFLFCKYKPTILKDFTVNTKSAKAFKLAYFSNFVKVCSN